MKTLLVTVDPAYPAVSGADLRNWQNARAAAKAGPVMLAAFGANEHSPPPGIELATIKGMTAGEVWAGDFDVKFTDPAIADFRSICARFRPDTIILESLPLVNLAGIARAYARAVVIDLHNIESLLALQFPAHASDTTNAQAKRLRMLEERALSLADTVWVCSSDDRAHLLKIRGAEECRVAVVPNGVPRPETVGDIGNDIRLSPPIVLFAGHLNYRPNVEAAETLASLMPSLRERMPGARLIIAGRTPRPVVARLAQPGTIEVVSNPASMDDILSRATVVAVPLRSGGGTRIKILEAMAWGVPVVATPRAAEGLGLVDGEHVTIAQTPDDFVDAIFALCSDPKRYDVLRRNAHRYVVTNFGMDAIHAAVRSALDLALANGEKRREARPWFGRLLRTLRQAIPLPRPRRP